MQIDLTNVIGATLTLCVFAVTAFLLPWIRNKLGAQKTEALIYWVKTFVQAAEQTFCDRGMGKEKKEYVLEKLREKGYTVDLNAIDAMIESAVLELNRAAAA